MLALGEATGTRIVSVTRQSNTLLDVVLAGGGKPDRVLVWSLATGRVVATLRLGN